MAVYLKDKIRNIAVIGHSGEGKTSLVEAILYKTKAIDRLGKVDDGNTVSDYDQEEINRGMSISLSLSYTYYKDCKFNFIDVPGFFDFEGEMISALSVADTAIIVTMAGGSLTVGTEKAIDYCLEKSIPMYLFVNGINKENTDYLKTIDAIKEKYMNKVTPIELPIMDGYDMKGYVDVISMKAYDLDNKEIDIPSSIKEKTEEYNLALTEFAAEASDDLLEKFFSGEELTLEEKKNGLKIRMMSAELIPAVAGVAVGKPSLSNLLDDIVSLFPSPAEIPPKKAKTMEGEEVDIVCDENEKFSCQIFKTLIDKFMGKVQLYKVASGKIKVGDAIFNTNKEKAEKASSILLLMGNKSKNVDELYAGDIGEIGRAHV